MRSREVLPRLSSGKINRNALKKEPLTARRPPPRRRRTRKPKPSASCSTPRKRSCRRRPSRWRPISSWISAAIRCSRRVSSRSCARPRLWRGSRFKTFTTGDPCARSRRCSTKRRAENGGPKDLSFTPPPLYPALPVRPRAGGGPAVPAGAFDRAMAEHFRLLHAADRHRRLDLAGNRLAARPLCLRQYRDRAARHRHQMAGHRPVQARALSDLGRLLFPLVAGPAHADPDPYQMVPGLAADAPLSRGARGESRPGRQYFRTGDRRHRSPDHRREDDRRRPRQFLQCHCSSAPT